MACFFIGVLATAVDPASVEKMDRLYSLALANELVPHVLVCFESIFNTSSQAFINKIRKYKTQMSHKSQSMTAATSIVSSSSSSGGGQLYLINNAHEGKELLGPQLFNKLDQHCWKVLKSGGFNINSDNVVSNLTGKSS